jgi:hypothetical protein
VDLDLPDVIWQLIDEGVLTVRFPIAVGGSQIINGLLCAVSYGAPVAMPRVEAIVTSGLDGVTLVIDRQTSLTIASTDVHQYLAFLAAVLR